MTYRTALRCPRCAAALIAEVLDGVRMHACGQCHGWFAEVSEIAALRKLAPRVQTVPDRMDGDDPSPSLRCPACSKGMARTYVVGAWLHVDYCREHGVWLDAGELERVAHQPAPQPAEVDAVSPAGLTALALLRALGIMGEALASVLDNVFDDS